NTPITAQPTTAYERRSDLIQIALHLLASGVQLMQKKETMTEPLPILASRSDSIPKAPLLGTGATPIRTKATTTEPSLILMRRSNLIPRVLSPLATGASLMRTKESTTEPSLILTW